MVMYVVYGPLRTVKVLRMQGVQHLSQHFWPSSWSCQHSLFVLIHKKYLTESQLLNRWSRCLKVLS